MRSRRCVATMVPAEFHAFSQHIPDPLPSHPALDSLFCHPAFLAFCTASFACPHPSHHDRGLTFRSNFPAMRHYCAPEPDWLFLVNAIRNPQARPSWSGAAATGKPRAGVLACILLLLSPRYHIEFARRCSECDRYLKRTSQRVGRVCYLPVPNVAI